MAKNNQKFIDWQLHRAQAIQIEPQQEGKEIPRQNKSTTTNIPFLVYMNSSIAIVRFSPVLNNYVMTGVRRCRHSSFVRHKVRMSYISRTV